MSGIGNKWIVDYLLIKVRNKWCQFHLHILIRFLMIKFRLNFFGRKEIGAKAAHKIHFEIDHWCI